MAEVPVKRDSSNGDQRYAAGHADEDGRVRVTVNVTVDPTKRADDTGQDAAPAHAAHDDTHRAAEKKQDERGEQGDGKPHKKPLYKRPALVGLVLLLLLILICVAIIWWRHSRNHASTDDAFIDGHVSTIAPQAGGRVIKLYVLDNQHVAVNQPLIDIDSSDYRVKLDQANAQRADAQSQLAQAKARVTAQQAGVQQAIANLRQIDAALAKAELDLRRYRVVNPSAVPKQEADAAAASVRSLRAQHDAGRQAVAAARAQVTAAQAQVQTAEAALQVAQSNIDAAKLQLSYTHVVAPIAGRVTRRSVEVGNFVNAGQPLMSIVSDDKWVTANFKETQLARMRTGQSVDIRIDAYPDVTFHGKVDSVQTGTGSFFSMLPAENATGNYVKVVQRVPVKITFDDDRIRNYTLAPGMSVVPDVLFAD